MRPYIAFALMSTLCLTLLTVQVAQAVEIAEIKSWIPPVSAQYSRFLTADHQPRRLILTSELTPEDDVPILVVARAYTVWYLNSETLEILRENTYRPAEAVVISRNGAHVAVLSRVLEEETNAVIRRIRVEDWKGTQLWETEARLRSLIEPTPIGGLVVCPLREESAYDTHDGKRIGVGSLKPNSLLLFDPRGNLLLESVSGDELYDASRGGVSRDGKYLAFTFSWIPPSNRGMGSSKFYNRACLALYDLDKGVELWRKFLDGQRGSRTIITGDADRIFGFAAELDSAPGAAGDYNAFLFDRYGNSLIREPKLPGSPVRVPQGLKVSPDERLCAFTTGNHRAYLVRLVDGSILWTLARPKGTAAITSLAVSNDGSVLLRVSRRTGKDRSFEVRVILVDSEGSEIGRIDVDEVGAAVWSEDGDTFWLAGEDIVTQYTVTDTPGTQESGHR